MKPLCYNTFQEVTILNNFNIEKRRKELNLTLEQIGNYVGVSKSTVKKWESGFIDNMKRDKIALLAEILQVSPLSIIGIDSSSNEYFEPNITNDYTTYPVIGDIAAGYTFTTCYRPNIKNLYGKWVSGTEYYVYNSDGTGYIWDEGDGVCEEEAQHFTWEVDESEMKHVYKTWMSGDVPMYYIITELTTETLKYHDFFNERDTYSFKKVG